MKIAACFLDGAREPGPVMDAMTGAMHLFDHQVRGALPVPGGVLGHVSPGLPAAVAGWARSEHGGNRLLIAGVPTVSGGTLASTLRGIVASDYRRAAAALSALDGVFAALFWDGAHGKLLVVTDSFGIQPVYMFRARRTLVLASELRAMCASGVAPVAGDPAGWGQFFAVGNTLGDSTLLAGVSLVPPATILEYEPRTDHLACRTYWEWPARRPDVTTLERVPTAEIVDLLQEDVRRYAALSPSSTLLLSGGFDSRILLSTLRREGHPSRALIHGHDNEADGADGRFATRVAQRVGLPHARVPTRPDYYSSGSYADYLIQNEAATPSLYLFIAQLSERITPDMHAIWDGLCPGFSLNEAGYPAESFAAYLRYKALAQDSPRWTALGRVFAPGVYTAMREGFLEGFRRESAAYSDDADGVWRFTLRNRGRHRVAPNPVKVFANHVLPFNPGSSRRYWELVSRIAPPLRENHGVYLRIFREQFPDALTVPFVSQSRVVRAAPWTDVRALGGLAPDLLQRLLNATVRRRHFMWAPSVIRDRVIAGAEVDHPDLNPDGVRALMNAGGLGPETDAARSALFYWQAWRWIMTGHGDRLRPTQSPPEDGRATARVQRGVTP